MVLGPRNLSDWQDQMYKGNIKPIFGVLGPSLPGLREGSLYVYVRGCKLFVFRVFYFRLVIGIRVCLLFDWLGRLSRKIGRVREDQSIGLWSLQKVMKSLTMGQGCITGQV